MFCIRLALSLHHKEIRNQHISMKYKFFNIIFAIISLSFLLCCQSQTHKELCNADNLLETNIDSAQRIIQSIQPSSLHSLADSAYYVLLKSIIIYKRYEKQPTSTLDFPVQFYEKEENYRLLQKAYYYRGAINVDNKGKAEISALDFKKAENLNEIVRDSSLIKKLYGSMTSLYFSSKNYHEHLIYEKKSLKLAQQLDDKELQASYYSGMAICLKALGKRGLAAPYVDSSLFFVNYMPQKESQSAIYCNSGNFFVDHDLNKASSYYRKALSLNPNNELAMFGMLKVAVYKEDEKNIDYWESKISTTNDNELKEEIYQLLKNDAQKKGQFKKAYFYSKKIDSLNFKLKAAITTYKVESVQKSYKHSVNDELMTKQAHHKLYTSLIGCTILLILTSFMIVMNKRGKNNINSLEINVSQLGNKAKTMETSIKEKNDIITQLQQQIKVIEESNKVEKKASKKSIEEIKQGLAILLRVFQNEKGALYDNKSRNLFILCYKIIDKDFISKLENEATLQEQLICVLIHNNFSKEQIINVLSLSDEAFRKQKSRTLNKLKDKEGLQDVCDILSMI